VYFQTNNSEKICIDGKEQQKRYRASFNLRSTKQRAEETLPASGQAITKYESTRGTQSASKIEDAGSRQGRRHSLFPTKSI
jgi:hypothetical protein